MNFIVGIEFLACRLAGNNLTTLQVSLTPPTIGVPRWRSSILFTHVHKTSYFFRVSETKSCHLAILPTTPSLRETRPRSDCVATPFRADDVFTGLANPRRPSSGRNVRYLWEWEFPWVRASGRNWSLPSRPQDSRYLQASLAGRVSLTGLER